MLETPPLSPPSSRAIWLVLLACLITYGVGAARTGFMGKDELRYAQVAKGNNGIRTDRRWRTC